MEDTLVGVVNDVLVKTPMLALVVKITDAFPSIEAVETGKVEKLVLVKVNVVGMEVTGPADVWSKATLRVRREQHTTSKALVRLT